MWSQVTTLTFVIYYKERGLLDLARQVSDVAHNPLDILKSTSTSNSDDSDGTKDRDVKAVLVLISITWVLGETVEYSSVGSRSLTSMSAVLYVRVSFAIQRWLRSREKEIDVRYGV